MALRSEMLPSDRSLEGEATRPSALKAAAAATAWFSIGVMVTATVVCWLDVYAFGHHEEKLGSPAANVWLGVQLYGFVVAVVAAPVFALISWAALRREIVTGRCRWLLAIAAGVALSGLVFLATA